jgi:DNA mismatch endonuclease (patch repair protein)
MPDIFTKEKRSEVMSRIRSSNTSPERMVFSAMRRYGVRFQRHCRGIPGTPDLARPSDKLAVFVDGDFWHGWKYAARRHKLAPFWQAKIERNMARDRRTFAALRRRGWRVLRVWEHELGRRRLRERTLERIAAFFGKLPAYDGHASPACRTCAGSSRPSLPPCSSQWSPWLSLASCRMTLRSARAAVSFPGSPSAARVSRAGILL